MDNFEFTQARIQEKLARIKSVNNRSSVAYCTRQEIADAIDIELILTHAGFWGRPFDVNRPDHRQKCIDYLLDGVVGRALGRLGLLDIELEPITPSDEERIAKAQDWIPFTEYDPQPGQIIKFVKGMEQAIAETKDNSPAERNGQMGTPIN